MVYPITQRALALRVKWRTSWQQRSRQSTGARLSTCGPSATCVLQTCSALLLSGSEFDTDLSALGKSPWTHISGLKLLGDVGGNVRKALDPKRGAPWRHLLAQGSCSIEPCQSEFKNEVESEPWIDRE
ncbi:hypothetical protein PsYK624_026510 [Phanerochaete sordida]|uniref:Uncharacterized protein n=1 Tax=Phanerochaete sordida TaxID=48140 RepID=A0A9P3G1K8_9APHY|nr:hypothetical protein PsYK624_026510 [Phanerochaete sordida]